MLSCVGKTETQSENGNMPVESRQVFIRNAEKNNIEKYNRSEEKQVKILVERFNETLKV
jgi:hypothetical protein